MADTSLSFVDPVFLAHFGLSRTNAIDYFFSHPLNPFRAKGTSSTTSSNEVLVMQGINLDTLFQGQIQQQHLQGRPYDPVSALMKAEHEYTQYLEKMIGEQYELVPKDNNEEKKIIDQLQPENATAFPPAPDQLFVIRHVLRSSRTTKKVLGIYYIIEGVIYKSPSVRSIIKANLSRTIQALSETCDTLSKCAKYEPAVGYTWDFDAESHIKEAHNQHRTMRKRPRKATNSQTQTEEEEEGLKASEAIDKILIRLNKKKLSMRDTS